MPSLAATVDDYLNQLEVPERTELERIRGIVKAYVPDAKEVISYRIPGFTYRGKYLMGYAAFRDHLSIFPTAEPIEVLAPKLGAYKLARGTIQYKLNEPFPEGLLLELLDVRIQAIGD